MKRRSLVLILCSLALGQTDYVFLPQGEALLYQRRLDDTTLYGLSATPPIAYDGFGGYSLNTPLEVQYGGMGVGTLTDHGLVLGSGTSAVTVLAAASNGQLPIGSTGADPVLATLTGTANQVIVTNGAGTITLASPQDLHPGASPIFAGLRLDGALDMNDNEISDVNYIDFNGVNGIAPAEGRLVWSDDEGTLNLGMKGGIVNQQIGLEVLVRVKNTSGSDIANGKAVRLTGATGNFPTIGLAEADVPATAGSIGLTTEHIDNNQFGYVTTFGLVRGDVAQPVDTSSYSGGDRLYVSNTAGELTDTAPTSDERIIFIGIVIVSNANTGIIWVNPINVSYLSELSGVNVTSIADEDILHYDSATGTWINAGMTVDTPVVVAMYDAEPARASETNWNGGLLALATGQALDSVPTDLPVTKGIGKVLVVLNAGGDFTGDITVTGETIDRDTGASTPADTDTLTTDVLTTDSSSTDSNGNTVHGFTNAYITSKWFTGSVTLSTANLTLTDVDVYHISFEQFNDKPLLVLNTFDASLFTTHVNAEFDAYLFDLDIGTGDKCNIENHAALHVGADGETAIANRYWRLRKGGINQALDGSTDGIWVDVHYSNSPAYIEDVTIKVWLTCTVPVELN